MNSHYRDIIRFSLAVNQSVSDCLDGIDCEDFYEFCHQHSITGVVLDGIDRANVRIDQKVLLNWIASSESIRRRNEVLNKMTVEISEWFRERGLRSVILKGQSNALMYPSPEVRSPGDIDVWVEGDEKAIIKMILEQCAGAHYSIHHIKMPVLRMYRSRFITGLFI